MFKPENVDDRLSGESRKMEKAVKEDVDNRKIIVRIRKKQNTTPDALFSSSDVRKFVYEFVSSWIIGDITIHFPTASELGKKTPLAIPFPVDPSVNAEMKIKEHYIDLLSVCAGIKKATIEEQEKAINDVFRMLLMFRSANRIEGKIVSNDLQKRVEELEKTINDQGRLIGQITGFLFKPKKSKVSKSR